MSGDDEEQPASNSAAKLVSNSRFTQWRIGVLQSKIIAIAIRIMRTWWYPKNGISPMRNGQRDSRSQQQRNVTHASTLSKIFVPLCRVASTSSFLSFVRGLCHSSPLGRWSRSRGMLSAKLGDEKGSTRREIEDGGMEMS